MTILVKKTLTLRKQVASWKEQGDSIAFVPTMGNLHKGHLSLVKLAQKNADRVVVSIFINPLQFGKDEDLESYPKTFAEDLLKLENLKTDILFFPSVAEMYPVPKKQSLVCIPKELTAILEGVSRPNHFDGVTTVVSKLFNIVQPDIAIFGKKDYQQLKIIEKMIADLSLPIEIIAGEIERDRDGLALSSRNQYLTLEQREIAPRLQEVLQNVAAEVVLGNRDFLFLEKSASKQLISLGFDSVDYIKIVDSKSLLEQSLSKNNSKLSDLVILTAVNIGKTRLLDNILLK